MVSQFVYKVDIFLKYSVILTSFEKNKIFGIELNLCFSSCMNCVVVIIFQVPCGFFCKFMKYQLTALSGFYMTYMYCLYMSVNE